MKFGFSQLLEKTPHIALCVGNLLMSIGTSGAIITLVSGNHTVSAIIALSGLVGKFMTEMFGEG